MPSFQEMFEKSGDLPIIYKGIEIVQFDRFPVENGDVLICSIEEAIKKEYYLQGFCIDITGWCELEGKIHKKGKGIRMLFWDGFLPSEIRMKVHTKLDHVIIYNICERDVTYLMSDETGKSLEKHSKTLDYFYNGAAMIVEEIEGGRRYRCSDTSSADKPFPFNDIVFTVRKADSMNLDKAIQNR